jgi:membrane protein DedA with SNARE-associated domain
MNSLRTGRAFQLAAGVLLVLAVAIILALLYGDLPEFLRLGGRTMREFIARHAFVPGFVLLYIEESGIPLPAPGDVFVMYVGTRVPHNLFAWIVAWLGLILAVVLGATNLFLISRRYGRRLVEHRYAEMVHLSPERIARAEAWFKRYGVFAIIFGRHIPGFRIPITVASGIFNVPYRMFAPSVAVSTAIWAGVVMIIGINFGPRLESLLRAHTQLYFVWGAIVVLLVAYLFIRAQRQDRPGVSGPPAEAEGDRPVESRSSSERA